MIEIKNAGETVVGSSTDTIRISNITTGVGIVFVDFLNRLGAGTHIVLPINAKKQVGDMLTSMLDKGSQVNVIWAKIAGGANFMSMDMGKRITESVIDACEQKKIVIKGQDIGGKEKRTLSVVIKSGRAKVLSVDGEKEI